VVFVCEHGAAKSVVAAAYFNKLAKRRHLNLYAIARGTTPQPEVSATVAQGLKADGVNSETKRPQNLSEGDVQGAVRIVAFCALPEKYSRLVPVDNWDDVPATSEGYAAVRDAILKHLQSLLEDVKPAAKKR
jgi:protein-tyrosine-phosphatase